MSDRPWLSAYPDGVPAEIDATQYPSLVALMEEAFTKYRDRVAYSFMGKEFTYAQTDVQSRILAAYLQGLGLVKGDRVALMMPNVPQYPVAVAAVLAVLPKPVEPASLYAALSRALSPRQPA